MEDTGPLAPERSLSPLRNTTTATSVPELVREQLAHFSIDPDGELGLALTQVVEPLYHANAGMQHLWGTTLDTIAGLDRRDRIAFFNAKRFLCFQLAKLLDTLQNPLRKSYQSLITRPSTFTAKGPYPIFDNVTAVFSATPVITRTATYLYACTEWIDDAFQGKELLHEIYSRLMNPTSTCLANHIVDIEAGRMAGEYFAWNFNSGMAAIDAALSHLVGHRDIVLSSRNIYGGAYQLIQDWFGKKSNLDVAVAWFDGCGEQDFRTALARVKTEHADRLQEGKEIYVYLESPCNPHGYVLDVPGICRAAHEDGITVICDATIGTPMLQSVLQRENPLERPDFVVHSYTKDLAGSGTTTAGVVIARNERMFIPKGERVTGRGPDGRERVYAWDETLFWNVYYVKGAFLDADKAFDVINGMRTLSLRMLQKCISTIVLSRVLASHPDINVNCSAVEGNENEALRREQMFLELPAPLFTIDLQGKGAAEGAEPLFDRAAFKRFFDCLEPAFGLQVSLGQVNTVVLCPALTSHSELTAKALRDAGITPTTIRIAVGDEDPRTLIAHLLRAAELVLDPVRPGFSTRFMDAASVDALYRDVYADVHRRWAESRPTLDEMLR
ncbi:MAG: PLP-dependent transferase [Deltaproteobacteria bacterium]|nr:PLP-dependent transferase [Deltaproteobacteria bacterium]